MLEAVVVGLVVEVLSFVTSSIVLAVIEGTEAGQVQVVVLVLTAAAVVAAEIVPVVVVVVGLGLQIH